MNNEIQKPSTPKTLVWDINTRIFHWLLVTLVIFQWLSGEILDDWINWHVISGYCLLGLIIFRIVWGIVGPRYARFRSFIFGPKTILNYAKTLGDRDSVPYAGHNPMGGLAVIAMLTLLLLQAVSGLFITDDIFTSGPYYSAVSGFWQDIFSTIHGLAFDILKIVIGLHLATIIFYKFYKGQPLVSAMIHGKKALDAKAIANHKWLLAIICVVLIASFVYLLVEVWPPVEDEFYDF